MISSIHENSNSKDTKSVFHHFCPGLPVSLTLCPITQCGTLSYYVVRYIVLDGFVPWVRGGCIACSRGRGGFQCGEDVYPSSHAGEDVYPNDHAHRTVEILQLPFSQASLAFWLFLASMVFGIALSPVHVCMHFGTPVLNAV